MKTIKSTPTLSEKDRLIRNLVIARLRSLPSGKKISLGSQGEFTNQELIIRVEKDDEVGKKITQIQLEYLRSLKNILNQ